MLFLLSFGSAMNQMMCFSFAPFASLAALRYGEAVVAQAEVVYFVIYIPMSFVGSYVVDKYGLRAGLVAACAAQTIGAWIRCSSFLFTDEATVVYIGQGIAALGMCVFVNSPPRLSTSWFPPGERTLSTNIAVNANAAGAALAYIFAPILVSSIADFPFYNGVVATAATICFVLTFFLFKSHPDWSSPSTVEEYDWSQWVTVLSEKGFKTTLIVFAVSECVINTMSTLLAKLLRPNGFSRAGADLLGAVFLLVCMAGGILFGTFQHKWNLHKNLAKCMVVCSVAMLLLRVVLAGPFGTNIVFVSGAVFMSGLFLGPLQATCNELGVECAFPVSENTVSAIQQLVGNLVSAIFIPFISSLHDLYSKKVGAPGVKGHVDSWRHWWAMPEVVISMMLLVCSFLLHGYSGAYRRLTMEREVKANESARTSIASDGEEEERQRLIASKPAFG